MIYIIFINRYGMFPPFSAFLLYILLRCILWVVPPPRMPVTFFRVQVGIPDPKNIMSSWR